LVHPLPPPTARAERWLAHSANGMRMAHSRAASSYPSSSPRPKAPTLPRPAPFLWTFVCLFIY
jgi:hypothetical protein